ncbi:FadR/GntR family transcriptional regulator [Flammeovirgaceae bacterium SG7u.111]|nr:FadR/GntR family transcriptional regulator [Flammeovirgaceae bacterium SG7u.132]WPO33235.1 FadR/GntR family transcriptional regulator [Flammeovirgaceae bacterium SG7u.111]
MSILENLKEIAVVKPSDIIIRQIRELISSGQLKPGDALPSERKLSEKFGVGRSAVRDAIKKLEFYGILNTSPQSGTVVAGMGLTGLKGLITDVLNLGKYDFFSLVETRVILETHVAELAAERRTPEDIVKLENALNAYEQNISEGLPSVEEDLIFHLEIAEAGKNPALKSLMMIVTPDLMEYFTKENVCGDGRADKAFEEHRSIVKYIKEGDGAMAKKAMAEHLNDVLVYSKKQRFL